MNALVCRCHTDSIESSRYAMVWQSQRVWTRLCSARRSVKWWPFAVCMSNVQQYLPYDTCKTATTSDTRTVLIFLHLRTARVMLLSILVSRRTLTSELWSCSRHDVTWEAVTSTACHEKLKAAKSSREWKFAQGEETEDDMSEGNHWA